MLCLGIESSCDESALALVRDGVLLAQTLKSQVDVHSLFGGVVPELASREHGRVMGALYGLLLDKAGISGSDIDCIAVARGPGLLGSLLVGVAYAKALALALQKPVVGVNHLHAHILAAGLERKLEFPALALLVSGGHTHIYLVRSASDFELLGRSLDDAAGEALDKFGKMIGLPYPAGRHLDRFSGHGAADAKMFPRPYIDNDNCDFSFSGLKTAALNMVEKDPALYVGFDPSGAEPELPEGERGLRIAGVCASYIQAVADTLVVKLRRAHAKYGGARSLILAGGVAANSRVRASVAALAEELGLELVIPGPALCTDNAAMIAYNGWLLHNAGLAHALDFAAVPRGRHVPDDYSRSLCRG